MAAGLVAASSNGFWGDTSMEHKDGAGSSPDKMLRRRLGVEVGGDRRVILTDE